MWILDTQETSQKITSTNNWLNSWVNWNDAQKLLKIHQEQKWVTQVWKTELDWLRRLLKLTWDNSSHSNEDLLKLLWKTSTQDTLIRKNETRENTNTEKVWQLEQIGEEYDSGERLVTDIHFETMINYINWVWTPFNESVWKKLKRFSKNLETIKNTKKPIEPSMRQDSYELSLKIKRLLDKNKTIIQPQENKGVDDVPNPLQSNFAIINEGEVEESVFQNIDAYINSLTLPLSLEDTQLLHKKLESIDRVRKTTDKIGSSKRQKAYQDYQKVERFLSVSPRAVTKIDDTPRWSIEVLEHNQYDILVIAWQSNTFHWTIWEEWRDAYKLKYPWLVYQIPATWNKPVEVGEDWHIKHYWWSRDMIGPWLAFANEYISSWKLKDWRKLLIVPMWYGSTSMLSWWEWASREALNDKDKWWHKGWFLYNQTIKKVNNILEEAPWSDLKALFWSQWEEDAKRWTQNYAVLLEEIFEWFKNDFDDDDHAIISSSVNSDWLKSNEIPESIRQHAKSVQDATKEVLNKIWWTYIDNSKLGWINSDLHLTAEEQNAMWELIAKEVV